MPGIFIQGRQVGKSYGSIHYLFSTYPNLGHQDYHNIMEDKATKIQSLLLHNKFRKKTKPILNDRINARTVETFYNLPPNTLVSHFPTNI